MSSQGASGSGSAFSGGAKKRLLRDFKNIQQDPPEGISASPINNNLHEWEAIMFGPDDTPLEGGVFKLILTFTDEYPQCPPLVKFQTQLFHPNVFKDGNICLDILRREKHRTPEGGANPEAERLFVHDRGAYDRKVKELVANQMLEDDDSDEDDEDDDESAFADRKESGDVTESTTLSASPYAARG